MSFYITKAIAFFSALPYTPHKATPHFRGLFHSRGFFQTCIQTTVFLLPLFLFFTSYLIDLKFSSMLISYILFWYIMSTLLTKMLN